MTDLVPDTTYRRGPRRMKPEVRARYVALLDQARVTAYLYCLRRLGDSIPIDDLAAMGRIAPKDASVCFALDCDHVARKQ